MMDQILLLIFVIVFIVLFFVVFFNKKEEAKEGIDFIIGAALGEKKFKESRLKKIMAKGLQKFKDYDIEVPVASSIVDIINPKFNYEDEFDSITHDILDLKKQRLKELNFNKKKYTNKYNNKWDLLTEIYTRIKNTKNNIAEENLTLVLKTLDKDQCLYDKETELLSVFVLNDKDDIMYQPFYNNNLLHQEIRITIMNIMREELSKYPVDIQQAYYMGEHDIIDFKIKNATIDKVKEVYKDKDPIILKNIIKKYISYD